MEEFVYSEVLVDVGWPVRHERALLCGVMASSFYGRDYVGYHLALFEVGKKTFEWIERVLKVGIPVNLTFKGDREERVGCIFKCGKLDREKCTASLVFTEYL